MNWSINLESVFGAVPLEDALRTLRDMGFDTFERWAIRSAEVPRLRAAMDETGMRMSACCPSFFTLNDPAAHDAYEASLFEALDVLEALGCRELITQVGQDTKKPRTQQHDAIVQGLRRVAPILESRNVTLLVEPLNDVRDHAGYYLTSSAEGFDIIREVASPAVRLLYDIYHQLHMGEDVFAQIAGNLDLIGHFHIAGFPARDERIFEGYDYRPLLRWIADHTDAALGIELFPGTGEARLRVLEEIRALG